MVKVKIFGVFRLDTGIKELMVEAGSVPELLEAVAKEAQRVNPASTITEKALRGCIVSVNGSQVSLRAGLNDGDEVMLVPAVAGG